MSLAAAAGSSIAGVIRNGTGIAKTLVDLILIVSLLWFSVAFFFVLIDGAIRILQGQRLVIFVVAVALALNTIVKRLLDNKTGVLKKVIGIVNTSSSFVLGVFSIYGFIFHAAEIYKESPRFVWLTGISFVIVCFYYFSEHR
jgi:hypothetical protein